MFGKMWELLPALCSTSRASLQTLYKRSECTNGDDMAALKVSQPLPLPSSAFTHSPCNKELLPCTCPHALAAVLCTPPLQAPALHVCCPCMPTSSAHLSFKHLSFKHLFSTSVEENMKIKLLNYYLSFKHLFSTRSRVLLRCARLLCPASAVYVLPLRYALVPFHTPVLLHTRPLAAVLCSPPLLCTTRRGTAAAVALALQGWRGTPARYKGRVQGIQCRIRVQSQHN